MINFYACWYFGNFCLFLSIWCSHCGKKSLEIVPGMFWNVGYQNVSRTSLWCSGCLQKIVKAPETVVILISNLNFWGGVICCHKTRREQVMVSFLQFSVDLIKSCASGKVSLFHLIYTKHHIIVTIISELNVWCFEKKIYCFLFVTIFIIFKILP